MTCDELKSICKYINVQQTGNKQLEINRLVKTI